MSQSFYTIKIHCRLPGSEIFSWVTVPKVKANNEWDAMTKVSDAFKEKGIVQSNISAVCSKYSLSDQWLYGHAVA